CRRLLTVGLLQENNAAGMVNCLLENKLAALENGTVHLGSADGAQLTFVPLPYEMPNAVQNAT
ncbi:MAG: hypothetical protein NWQ13_04825, partial [Glaciimonas sp.]|nr:hypothetical protein [Glaciimonas sp.]